MSLYAISDLHLALFNKEKNMEAFRGWANYVQRIEKNWKALVKEDDEVVVAGDISWALKLKDSKDDLAFLNALPGRKILLKGNHDLWWSTKKKVEDFFAENNFNTLKLLYNTACVSNNVAICGSRGWLYDSENKDDRKILLREAGRLEFSLKDSLRFGLETIAFLHYPPVYSEFKVQEILDVLKKYNIKKCYFGHIHGSIASKVASTASYEDIKFQLISADSCNFTPILVKK